MVISGFAFFRHCRPVALKLGPDFAIQVAGGFLIPQRRAPGESLLRHETHPRHVNSNRIRQDPE